MGAVFHKHEKGTRRKNAKREKRTAKTNSAKKPNTYKRRYSKQSTSPYKISSPGRLLGLWSTKSFAAAFPKVLIKATGPKKSILVVVSQEG